MHFSDILSHDNCNLMILIQSACTAYFILMFVWCATAYGFMLRTLRLKLWCCGFPLPVFFFSLLQLCALELLYS